jgi:rubrerythrin
MNSERYFNQQIIERYRKLLEIVSDQTQRRQIMNLLEDEEDKARDLGRSKRRLDLSQAA